MKKKVQKQFDVYFIWIGLELCVLLDKNSTKL